MILLKHICLVNWYGFNHIEVPIGDFSLIAGKNGNGKSVMLDAIKYALYGDTVFNKSTDNKGSRSLSSYTRGLLDATAGTYMRSAETFNNVYTHIILEMYEVELEKSFVLGTAIVTNSANGINTYRYIIENTKLSDFNCLYEKNGLTIPYSNVELQKKYGLKMLEVTLGIEKFMQRTGLHLNARQMVTFRRKLRSIISYNPEAKIEQFIRESVLEEKKIDFSKLIEAKNNIDKLKETFENLDREIKELDQILVLFEKLKNAKNIIFEDDVKSAYKKTIGFRNSIDEIAKKIDIEERQLADDEKKLIEIQKQEKDISDSLRKIEKSLDDMDCTKAINEAKEKLDKLTSSKESLKKEKEKLETFQRKISELINWLYEENIAVNDQSLLSSLTTTEHTAAEKANSVESFLTKIKKARDDIFGTIKGLENDLKNNRDMQSKQQRVIDDCKAKKNNFSNISDYVKLKDEINKEFSKKQISSKAKLACEYVIGLQDEEWRDAIECFLGRKSYTILVEPKDYDIADDVFNASLHRGAHLFNTKLLMKKEFIIEKDSVFNFVDVKNTVAKKYFEYQLGRIHAVTKEQVRNFENAISKEGRVSLSMDSYFLKVDKISTYYLGQDTIEMNRGIAEKRLSNLENEYKELKDKKQEQDQKKEYLDTVQRYFTSYDYDACQLYEDVLIKYNAASNDYENLRQAQQNNTKYMEMYQLREKYQKEFDINREDKIKVENRQIDIKTQLAINRGKKKEKTEDLDKYEGILKDYKIQDYDMCKKAIKSYDKYIENGKMGIGGTLKNRFHAEEDLKKAERGLLQAQYIYNASRNQDSQLGNGVDRQPAYKIRKDKIWADDLQEIQSKNDEQTEKYEKIFKNEFVLTVLKYCEDAKYDLDSINTELLNLKFKSKYLFDVKYVKDGSDYEKILEYAKYLKEREDLGIAEGQMVLQKFTSFSDNKSDELEYEIQKIINSIIDSNDNNKIEKYADYRNYMTYEILLTNDVLNRAKLSKQSGYNSGAEVQIPYMLILLSALLLIYREKGSSTRLVFIDEPFAKMDPGNVKIMLDFMKKQRLQMIFCAPDKTELIGNECDVILPILKTKKDLMEIGIIEMHKGV